MTELGFFCASSELCFGKLSEMFGQDLSSVQVFKLYSGPCLMTVIVLKNPFLNIIGTPSSLAVRCAETGL